MCQEISKSYKVTVTLGRQLTERSYTLAGGESLQISVLILPSMDALCLLQRPRGEKEPGPNGCKEQGW